MNRYQRHRLRLFEQGVEAFSSHFPGYGHVYVCPTCLVAYTSECLAADELTLEHVPPANMGGRRLVLLCRSCNDRFGHSLDHHARTLEDTLDFEQQTLARSVDVNLTLKGVTVRAEALRDGEPIALFGLADERINNPDHTARFDQAMRSIVANGRIVAPEEIHIEIARKYVRRRALVSWLRSAYLTAFALFGYRYILSTELKRVRQQINQFDTEIIRFFSASLPSASRTRMCWMIVDRPEHLRSLAVVMGRHTVLLPWFNQDAGLYEAMEREALAGREFQISGTPMEWPPRPVFHYDLIHRLS